MKAHVPLYIAPSEFSGRGVFSTEAIRPEQLIEECPVISLPTEDLPLIHKTGLHDYYFIWGEHDDLCAIILGYGSLYNHSFSPNAEYRPDYTADTLRFYALQAIPPDTEITVNYNGTPSVSKKLWFEAE